MKKITMFHGQECPHCAAMQPIVDRLIKEGFNIEKKEVWHNERNAQEMRKFSAIISEACGGDLCVPAFVDETNNKTICGEFTYEELKEWMSKE
jgi:hypothetical protein